MTRKHIIFSFAIFVCLSGGTQALAQETSQLSPPMTEEWVDTENSASEGVAEGVTASSSLLLGVESDWELYMLRLVNRSRQDPSGEAARIGSSVVDTRAPVPPLAYDLLIGGAATNHNNWMHDNFGGISSGRAPDSFTHYETLDGNSTGAPAVGTPSYTGATLGSRITFAGYSWGSCGENILTSYSSNIISINRARIDNAHRSWWESPTGHRNNMLSANFTAFGFQIEHRAFVPPRGGLAVPVDNLLFAIQSFARPLSTPRYYIFGLLYSDRDGDSAWTPREINDPLREGLMNVAFQVYLAGTNTSVSSGTTMGHGAFSVRLSNGSYDIVFTDSRIPNGQLRLNNITLNDMNVDIGDREILPADALTISESSPPNGYIDPLQDRDAATGFILGTEDVYITFSAPVRDDSGQDLTLANFEWKYFRNGSEITEAPFDLARGTAPTVRLMSGSGPGPYLIRFSPRIPLGAWTQIEAVNVVDFGGQTISPAANKIVLGSLPMDITQDGKVLGDDINRWFAINNDPNIPTSLKLPLLDQTRNGIIAGEDNTRGIQLMNGIGTFQSWRGFNLGLEP